MFICSKTPASSSENPSPFRNQSTTRSAIKLEWETDAHDDSSTTWTRGPIKTPRARPAIRLEWDDEVKPPEPTLQLTVRPDPTAQAIDLAFGFFDLMTTVNDFDRSLDGVGLKKVACGQKNGIVTITLTAERQPGATERIQQICAECNRTNEPGARFTLPDCVTAIEARVG